MNRSSIITAAVVSVFMASCAQTPPPAPVAKLNDGELAVPAGYITWKSTMLGVQRPDVKQIRDIYVNDTGAKNTAGGKFANGTLSVMEIHAAKLGADGNAITGADGNMIKDKLVKVFVMGKDAGWGEKAPDSLKNGNWIYSGYLADGKTASPDPTVGCRGCHLPIGESKDFFHRYDEYFLKRKS